MAAETALHFDRLLLPAGWKQNVRVRVRDGQFAEIAPDSEAEGGGERYAIGLPGLSNLHSHAFQRGMAGLAEKRSLSSDSFWTWRDVMYRFVDRLTPDDLFSIASLAYAEMLETGFTRVGEFHYLHHDRDGSMFADSAEMSGAIFAAAEETGIALTHLPVFYAHSGFGGLPPTENQRRFVHDVDSFARLMSALEPMRNALPDAVLGIAPHSLRATTPGELSELIGQFGRGPIHMHVAEQIREVDDCVASTGRRPVEWLLENAAPDERWCLVHATHMTDEETRRVALSGAVVGLCPITEANLGDGFFPIERYLQSNGRFGLGSDSNVLIDASEEMRLLEYGQRLVHRQRNLISTADRRSTGSNIFHAAMEGGAQALGGTAGIATGSSADLISIRADHPSLVGRHGDDVLDSWVFAAGRDAIDCVWRRGVKVVSQGRHQRRSLIVDRYSKTLNRLTI